MTSPLIIVPRFEPQPFWHLFRAKVAVVAFYRPRDLCFGLQFLRGGVMLHVWPVSVGIVDPRKATR